MTQSERVVGEAFRQIFPSRTGRILISSFASNLHRMQQAADVGVDCGRKVAFVGRSMRKNANIARTLGYMDVPDAAILKPEERSPSCRATSSSSSAPAARASRCRR